MRSEFLDLLVEPGSHLPLVLENAVWTREDIVKGTLQSPSGNSYPIIDGIPWFVKAENYTASFGMQWKRFARTQLDSITGCSYSRSRFEAEVGWDKKWFNGKWVLDAGCGAGRFAEIAAELGCKLVAVDMSHAVDAAKLNLSRFQNIHFVHADIYNLPFRPGTFDGMYCIGVLQHTPNPFTALHHLLSMVALGGRFAITIYAKRPWTKLYSKYWVRTMVCGLSDEKLLGLIERIMPLAFPVTDMLFRIPTLGNLFRFLIPIANYVEKKDMTKKQRYEEAILDTFDMLSPRYDNPVSISRVIDILSKFKVYDYTILSRHPVNVVGQI